MAVQQNRKTRSKRGMRRAHDALVEPTLSVDSADLSAFLAAARGAMG